MKAPNFRENSRRQTREAGVASLTRTVLFPWQAPELAHRERRRAGHALLHLSTLAQSSGAFLASGLARPMESLKSESGNS